MPRRDYRDAVVVITGAGSGIGRELALLLGGRGARLVLSGRRRDRLDAVRDEVGSADAPAPALPFDAAGPPPVPVSAASDPAAPGRLGARRPPPPR